MKTGKSHLCVKLQKNNSSTKECNYSEKALMLYLLVFMVYFLNLSNTGTFKIPPLNELDADTKEQECLFKIDLNPS